MGDLINRKRQLFCKGARGAGAVGLHSATCRWEEEASVVPATRPPSRSLMHLNPQVHASSALKKRYKPYFIRRFKCEKCITLGHLLPSCYANSAPSSLLGFWKYRHTGSSLGEIINSTVIERGGQGPRGHCPRPLQCLLLQQ